MKKNLLLSFVILFFSFISFILFMVQTYYLSSKINEFFFLMIALVYLMIFSIFIAFIAKKIFSKKSFYREFSISFLIIMVSFMLVNLIEMALLKSSLNLEGNNTLYFIASLLQTLRFSFEFSIPIYFLVNILEFTRSRLFKGVNYESACN